MSRTRAVAVFRHSHMLPSEVFIRDQASALGIPFVLVGRDSTGSTPSDPEVHLLGDGRRDARVRHTLFRDWRPLAATLRDLDVGLVHAHFGVEGMYSLEAARRLGLPHVTTLHGFDVTMSSGALARSGRPAWLRYAAMRSRFLRSGSELVCVSEHIRSQAIALGAPERSTHVIGIGVDTRALSPSPVPAAPVVVHVARLVEKKGTSYLIRAMVDVVAAVPDARLRIIGDGPLRAELEDLVNDLGLASSVTFAGMQPHAVVLDEIEAARVLCLPSVEARSGDAEGLGQVLLEAGALGRPTVATRHGGIVDGVLDGVTGRLVSERSVPELSGALVELLQSDPLAQSLGEAARSHVEANFDVHAQAAKMVDLFVAKGLR